MKHIIEHHKFQETLKQISIEQGLDLEVVKKQGADCIKELYSQQNPIAKLLSVKSFNYILSRAYNDRINVDPKGIKKLMNLMQTNSVAFIITHKTYLDTLVLILTLAHYGMPIPYSFGGINLAFPGLKQLANNAGIIFIRRSFKDDLIYKAALRHYISTIIDKGDHFTWNIEGTRSRTGKIIYPKMGILKYIKEGELQSTRKIKYVPVSIVYDLIPDVKQMTEEGIGNEKKSEDVKEAIDYIKKLGNDYGRAAIRFGDPVEIEEDNQAIIPDLEEDSYADKNTLPRFAFELIHKANAITPITTVSLVCHVLLNDFALTKKEIEFKVNRLMTYIGKKKAEVLIDQGKKIGVVIQRALNLLQGAHIIQKSRAGKCSQYVLVSTEYLSANYYANMASYQLYHRAFIEMALVKIKDDTTSQRIQHFWEEIMNLRNLFKFEFFYTNKPNFSSEIEAELLLIDKNWRNIIADPTGDIYALLSKQDIFVSRAIILSYLDANKVVCHTLGQWDIDDEFKKEEFIEFSMFKGKELHWQSKITRLDSVSKPFLINALRFAKNANLIPIEGKIDYTSLEQWSTNLDDLSERLFYLKKLETEKDKNSLDATPTQQVVDIGSIVENEQHEKEMEEGSHITAFFDMDRTLIDDFSAKKFMTTRFFSGETTAKEYFSQFFAAIMFAMGNRDFVTLTKIAALGAKGIEESTFVELGQQVFDDFLKETIYPESRKLIEKHLFKGHRVVIVSAATTYQINPIAKALGIKEIYATEMEIRNGRFTGRISEMCWSEGKARAGRKSAKKHKTDLSKSYFYTDSIDDLPLLELVGHPVATNPDQKLSQIAFENNWPILRFEKAAEKPVINGMRTALAAASLYPSFVKGLIKGAITMSRQEAANTTFSSIGDLGAKMAGLDIAVKGRNNLEEIRPAIFCFNHQSAADFFIVMKLIRYNFTGIAKKELERTPVGPIFKALGAIYVDRSNKEKALESMNKVVKVLKNGISVAIAPEGTRSGSKTLGPFKKGAFHLAMQASVPIIPIVIKNAYMAMPKGTSLLKPTHIEVIVLDPIDTSLWKLKDIDKHIEDVRNLYLNELEN